MPWAKPATDAVEFQCYFRLMSLWKTKNPLIPCFQKLMLRGEPRVAESVLSHQPGTTPCSTKCYPAEGRVVPPGLAKEFH